jgi:predicted transcriptional regulator of viral defense system
MSHLPDILRRVSPLSTLAQKASRQHGIFVFADAIESGFSRRQADRLAATEWERLYDGVFRMPGAPATWRSELFAATVAATPPVGISFSSAIALQGLPRGRTDIVEVTCKRWLRIQRRNLVVHESTRFTEQDITMIDGIPVTTAERLIVDMAGRRPFPEYIESLIQAARRKRLITYDSTLATFNRLARRGLRGVKAMRIALERWDELLRPTESEMETLLIQVLREHGLPEPVPQFTVLDQQGNFVARTDAAIPEWRVIVEYQSNQEHLDEFQVARDDRRRNKIIAAGYFPLAARLEDLRNGGQILVDEILRTARRPAS